MTQYENMAFLEQALASLQNHTDDKAKLAAVSLIKILQDTAQSEPSKVDEFINENKEQIKEMTNLTSSNSSKEDQSIKPTNISYSSTGNNLLHNISATDMLSAVSNMKGKIATILDLGKKVDAFIPGAQINQKIHGAIDTLSGGLKSVLGETGANIALGFLGLGSNQESPSQPNLHNASKGQLPKEQTKANSKEEESESNGLLGFFSSLFSEEDSQKKENTSNDKDNNNSDGTMV